MNEASSVDSGGAPAAVPADVCAFLLQCGVSADVLAAPAVMLRFYEDLRSVSDHLNLARISSPDDFWIRHVSDSLAVGRVAPSVLKDPVVLADVGPGGGFPLFPLVWANPAISATAIETRKRRVEFLREEARRLRVSDRVVVVHRQAREVGRLAEHSGRYDVVTARAVAPAGRLIRDCRQLLRPGGGLLVLYKTPGAVEKEREEARREVRKYGLRMRVGPVFDLPRSGGTRQFLVIERP